MQANRPLTEYDYLDLIEKDPNFFDQIPEEYQNRAFYLKAARSNWQVLNLIPKIELDQELYSIAVAENGYALSLIPSEFHSLELYKSALNSNCSSFHLMENDLKTQDLCEIAVSKLCWNLQHVPDKYQTTKMCLFVVKKSGICLQYVNNQTPEICLEAMLKDNESWKYVSDFFCPRTTFNEVFRTIKYKVNSKIIKETIRSIS